MNTQVRTTPDIDNFDADFLDRNGIESTYPPSVLGKAFLVFESLKGSSTPIGLTELSRRTGVPKATVYRLASELIELGLIVRHRDGYHLGWKLYDLARNMYGTTAFVQAVRPSLLDLHVATGAIIRLSIQHGLEVVHLERLVSRKDANVALGLLEREACVDSAAGRLFLALKPSQEFSSKRISLQVQEQLATFRRQRWAQLQEQRAPGFTTFAVPITSPGSTRIIAAISASCATNQRYDRHVLRSLQAVASSITRVLSSNRAANRSAA